MSSLEWRTSPPRPDPFAAIAGDLTQYRVHFTESAAHIADAEFENHLEQIVQKAMSFAVENVDDGISRILFLWDGVYATLTVVYADEAMERDAHHVIKCQFTKLDKELHQLPIGPKRAAMQNKVSAKVRSLLERRVGMRSLKEIPARVDVFYSDQDRASYGSSKILVHRLIPCG